MSNAILSPTPYILHKNYQESYALSPTPLHSAQKFEVPAMSWVSVWLAVECKMGYPVCCINLVAALLWSLVVNRI